MIFICISLIICDVEHLFMCVRAILIYLWKNFPFSSSTYFKTYCFFLLLSCAGSLYSLDISPLSDIWFVKIFPHSVGCLFILLMVSFAVTALVSYSLNLLPSPHIRADLGRQQETLGCCSFCFLLPQHLLQTLRCWIGWRRKKKEE